MQTRHAPIYDDIHNELYIADPTQFMLNQNCTCENCKHWAFEVRRDLQVYADVKDKTVQVAQCTLAGQDDKAPYAEVLGPEAAVFTQAESRCEAFEVRQDVAELMEDVA